MNWMHDTTPVMARMVAERFAAMTPTERALAATSMFDTARLLAAAGMGTANPTKVQMLDHLYPELRGDAALRAQLAIRDKQRE